MREMTAKYSPVTCTTVYEGLEEYSFKYFAVRKERVAESKDGDGPLVSLSSASVYPAGFYLEKYVRGRRWRGA